MLRGKSHGRFRDPVVVSLDEYKAHKTHGSGNPRGLGRRKKIVKPLNSPHARVLNVPGLKFLEPLETELRTTRKVSSRDFAFTKKTDGSFQKGLGHAPSIGKLLPERQIALAGAFETLYPDSPVIFSRMKTETAEDVARAVAKNGTVLKKKYHLSGAKIANAQKDISPKSVSNAMSGRHSVTLATIVAVAHGLGLETWQLLVADLPEEYEDQVALAQVVRAFVKLGAQAREGILHAAQNEARGERKFAEIFGTPLPRAAGAE